MTALLLVVLAQCPTLADVPAPGSCTVSDAGVPSCAPGAHDVDDPDTLCPPRGSGVTTAARRCTFDSAFRKAMARAYGVERCGEVDHRLSLELGGSNSIANLWCEPAPEFHAKDAVEDHLHAAYCSGQLSLEAARALLLDGWRSVYAGMKR